MAEKEGVIQSSPSSRSLDLAEACDHIFLTAMKSQLVATKLWKTLEAAAGIEWTAATVKLKAVATAAASAG